MITRVEEKHKKEPLEFNVGDRVITVNKLLDSGNIRKIAISKVND